MSSGYRADGYEGTGDRRINADTLYTAHDYSDEDDVAIKGRPKKKKAPMPMGIRRVEHEEEKVTLTSAADIEAQEKGQVEQDDSSDGLFVDENRTAAVGVKKDDTVWEHAKPKTRAIQIKNEDDTMDLDNIPETAVKTPESPELKKSTPLDDKKKVTKKGDTEEEIEAEDLQSMLNLFTIGEESLEGHMFMFQFPPVLPPLKPAARDKGKQPANAMEEDDDDDGFIYSNTDRAFAEMAVDSTGEPVKIEEEEEEEEEDDLAAGRSNGLPNVGGYVGQLVVRKSGKVELDWGGVRLGLSPGLQTGFLRHAVLIDHDKDAKPQPGQSAGAAYGMGKIQGSFVVAPVWGEAEEWVVDPKDLEIPEE